MQIEDEKNSSNNSDSDEEKEDEEIDDDLKHYLSDRWVNTKKGFQKAWINFVDDIRHPRKAIVELFKSKQFITNALAIIVGIIGALAAWGFEWVSFGSDYIFMEKLFGLMGDNFGNWKFLAIIITPLIASLITSPIIWRFNPESSGSGIPYVMESIVLHDGYMRKRTPFIKMITSAISSGGGLSVGREGPIIQIGAGFSSGIARLVGLHGRSMRIVVISGLAAGIAATFNSPIGGALFGIEILLVSLVADEIVPIVIASLTSSTCSAIIDLLKLSPNSTGIPEPSFNVDVLRELSWSAYIFDLHWFILLGVLAGIVGVLYTRFFHLIRGIFERLPFPKMSIPIFGALLTGLICLLSPKNVKGIPLIFGAGYQTITNILNNSSDLQTQNPFSSMLLFLFVLFLLKIIVTSFSVGSGNPGGIFAPALYVGTCVGGFFAYSINSISNSNLNISIFALAGLASVFAGATRAPLTMIFMGAEMTGNIMLMIPLMLTCSISYLICRIFLKESIYTQSLVDKGLKISLGGNATILTTTKVEEIMIKNVTTIKRDITMGDVITKIEENGPFGYPITDDKNRLLGMITISDIKMAKQLNKLEEKVEDHMAKNVTFLLADMTIDEALDKLIRSGIQRAPVVNNKEEKVLIGILSKTDIVRSFEREKLKAIN
ncbi:MAG: CBS domain-containing protein [Candidatus Heimdallarchaeota archaeon]|nr:CBS domain-containing protein [Candidatus Heimdallarchaeota archaeon]